jgi:sec-independent protein translocase protein TatA
MGSLGPIHWLIVGAVVLMVFGGKIKLSAVMGDAAQGCGRSGRG